MLLSGVEGRAKKAPGARGDASVEKAESGIRGTCPRATRALVPRQQAEILAKGNSRRRDQYALNPEPTRARNRAWYQQNKDQRHDYYLRRKAAEPADSRRQRERELTRRRYLSDPAAWLARQKEWRQRNPDKAHAYVRASKSKRRRAAGNGSFTSAEWLALLACHGGRCAFCGKRRAN